MVGSENVESGFEAAIRSMMRLAVYSEDPYRRHDGSVYADMAFSLFVTGLAAYVDRLVIVARLESARAPGNHRIPDEVEFVALPDARDLSNPFAVAAALPRALRRFWATLAQVDAVWLFGPSPVALLFAVLARLRRRRLALAVRQDYPAYIRNRHPERRWLHLVARALDAAWRALARRAPTVVVGDELARRYRRAGELLPIAVSLVSERDVVTWSDVADRDYDGDLAILSVGRLDPEKNPLLLADILSELIDGDPRWRLLICGSGSLEAELRARLDELGAGANAELLGYVPLDSGLRELYRRSHFFLHVSLTEGLPQVLFEAMAAGLPVVATDVGAVATVIDGGAGLLIPPGDAPAAARALRLLATDPDRRRRLIQTGLDRVRAHTKEAETKRVAAFLGAVPRQLPIERDIGVYGA